MFGAQSGWTEERTERARRLWFTGHSAQQVANSLGGGITRNAVIGKMNRIGAIKLKKERKPYKPKVVRIPAEVREVVELEPRAPRPPREALPPEPQRPDKLVSFEDLTEKTCRFIYGDVRDPDHGFCPCERVAGSSYCAGHHGKCFTAPAVRTRSKEPGAVFNRFGRGRLRDEVLA
ncbi:GcrA family cell cycle regulator [Hyphomicrobium sp. DMF-1]|uniref:GcrA family cell cycle regulator n=1 Tax=Hyphomicrobium sp. DMF-1 TaxID=3019544 RepID=UPI0022EBD925|nr:GcrA family cell cycle regulator [Hyphomicrobium sp. DMF-1]WBT40147.1 hypothetical protein PE058_09770 [Hyphomicrobium sp. DMF-1]